MSVRIGLLAALAACSGDDGVTLDGSDSGTTPSTSDCLGADTFVVGLSKVTDVSGSTVAFVSAVPTPPDVGDNLWTFEVTDSAGAPTPGLSIQVTPWMPLHGHGLVPPDYGATDGGDGTYEVDSFDLIMPGLWEFTVDLGTGGAPDTAKFAFCAEG